jgi:hypothetical protein
MRNCTDQGAIADGLDSPYQMPVKHNRVSMLFFGDGSTLCRTRARDVTDDGQPRSVDLVSIVRACPHRSQRLAPACTLHSGIYVFFLNSERLAGCADWIQVHPHRGDRRASHQAIGQHRAPPHRANRQHRECRDRRERLSENTEYIFPERRPHAGVRRCERCGQARTMLARWAERGCPSSVTSRSRVLHSLCCACCRRIVAVESVIQGGRQRLTSTLSERCQRSPARATTA